MNRKYRIVLGPAQDNLLFAKPMKNIASYPMLRWLAPLGALGLVALQLVWESWHGGIVSHHLLNRADLPAISNWWGLFTLPVLAWLAVWRAEKEGRSLRTFTLGFIVGLLFGISVAVLFRANLHDAMLYMLGAAALLSLALPAYRLECMLGFFVGAMVAFGGLLPLLPAAPIVLVSLFFRVMVWRGMLTRR